MEQGIEKQLRNIRATLLAQMHADAQVPAAAVPEGSERTGQGGKLS